MGSTIRRRDLVELSIDSRRVFPNHPGAPVMRTLLIWITEQMVDNSRCTCAQPGKNLSSPGTIVHPFILFDCANDTFGNLAGAEFSQIASRQYCQIFRAKSVG